MEVCINILVSNIVDFIYENKDLMMIFYNEMAIEIPELVELKAKRIPELIKTLSGFLTNINIDPNDNYLLSMIGPSLLAVIVNNFRIQSMLRTVFKVKINKEYYKDYANIISTFYIEGINGVAKKVKKKRGK